MPDREEELEAVAAELSVFRMALAKTEGPGEAVAALVVTAGHAAKALGIPPADLISGMVAAFTHPDEMDRRIARLIGESREAQPRDPDDRTEKVQALGRLAIERAGQDVSGALHDLVSAALVVAMVVGLTHEDWNILTQSLWADMERSRAGS